jgi:hypothetical protein
MNEVIKQKMFEITQVLENYNAVPKAELSKIHEHADRALSCFQRLYSSISNREMSITESELASSTLANMKEVIKLVKQTRGMPA